MPEEKTRRTGPLHPTELASAAVMATLAAILTVAGWFLPHLGVIAALAVVPLGVVGHQHRLRAVLACTFAAATLSFLVAGTGSVTNVIECAAVGGLIGIVKRREWGAKAVVLGVAVIGPALAGVSDGLLWLFVGLRRLTIDQIRNSWTSVRHLLAAIPGSAGAVSEVNRFVLASLHYWWASVGVVVIGATIWFALVGWVFLGAVLERLEWIRTSDQLGQAGAGDAVGGVDPVPVRLEGVHFRYPGATGDALAGVDLELAPAEMVAVVGDNGSGKSTLVRVLAGQTPTRGRVTRPGGAGLGRSGGTALIMQHPETQVLGVRVADDVVWGLADDHGVDVDGLLDAVGLGGFAGRETSGLSGGELQRLAVAAALARRPRLLLSDESTAMVDEQGREDLVDLLRRLARQEGIAVVHVTHRPEEAARADRQLTMVAGRVVGPEATGGSAGLGAAGGLSEPVVADGLSEPVAADGLTEPVAAEGLSQPVAAGGLSEPVAAGGWPGRATSGARADRTSRLELIGVSHTYGIGTPWATPALDGVDLCIEPGDGLLVVGGNGSGKSTLAWILAGLLRPSYGHSLFGGEPAHTRIGSVGLAFQHARLQLQRATVGRDLKAAGAPDDAAVRAALRAVGLDPGLAERRIDALSGGQQRRVALAGILARQPKILVLDEPLAGLDRPSRAALVELLVRLRREQTMSLIVISHDLHGMERACDRMIQLDRGRVVAESATPAGRR